MQVKPLGAYIAFPQYMLLAHFLLLASATSPPSMQAVSWCWQNPQTANFLDRDPSWIDVQRRVLHPFRAESGGHPSSTTAARRCVERRNIAARAPIQPPLGCRRSILELTPISERARAVSRCCEQHPYIAGYRYNCVIPVAQGGGF